MWHFLKLHVQAFANINVNVVTSQDDQRCACIYTRLCLVHAAHIQNPAKFIQGHRGSHQSFTQRGLASQPVPQTPAMTTAEVGGSMHKYSSRFQATSAFSNSPIYNLIIGTNSVLRLSVIF